MPAALHNIVIEQGADFNLEALWQDSDGAPVNLTGYSAAAQVRASYVSTTVALTLAVELGGEDGTIVLSAAGEETEAVRLQNNKGVWDLKLTDSEGNPDRLLEGRVTLKPEVTR